jgi:hypothetical protein
MRSVDPWKREASKRLPDMLQFRMLAEIQLLRIF